MSKLLAVLIAVVTSQGWQWLRVLQEHQWIHGNWPVWLGALLSCAFLLHQIWLQRDRPAPAAKARERAAVVNIALEGLLKGYDAIWLALANAAPTATRPIVRCNVMLPVHRLTRRNFLRIFYKGCPDGISYTAQEMELRWSKKNGVVGWVWKHHDSRVFSVARGDDVTMAQSLSPTQRTAISRLQSVHSVPIFRDGKTVGVLTLDSQEDLNRTFFERDQVRQLLRTYADALPSQCFPEGVKD